MAGKPNTKWRETMLKKFNGNETDLKEYMMSIGSKGGKNSTTGGFYANRELARIAGRKGGKISRRRKVTI
jgi:hypothetical protein